MAQIVLCRGHGRPRVAHLGWPPRSPVLIVAMKLYQPVKDTPRRFCPTGWGLPRLRDRVAFKSAEGQSPPGSARAQLDKLITQHLGARSRRRR